MVKRRRCTIQLRECGVTVNTSVKLDRPVADGPTGDGAAVHTQVELVAIAV